MTDPTTLNLSFRELDLILPELTEDERLQVRTALLEALEKLMCLDDHILIYRGKRYEIGLYPLLEHKPEAARR